MHKDLKRIIEQAVEQGFDWYQAKNGHIVVTKDGRKVSTFSGTPSDGRSWKNSLAALRRAGFIRR